MSKKEIENEIQNIKQQFNKTASLFHSNVINSINSINKSRNNMRKKQLLINQLKYDYSINLKKLQFSINIKIKELETKLTQIEEPKPNEEQQELTEKLPEELNESPNEELAKSVKKKKTILKSIAKMIKKANDNPITLEIKPMDNMVSALNNQINKPSKKSLSIGINYLGQSCKLNGCINDAMALTDLLKKNNYETYLLTDLTPEKPTRSNILKHLQNLLENSNAGDMLFLSFSGHGSFTKDMDGNELTGNDQMMMPIDLKPIIDDELNNMINKYLKQNVTLIALFDCCYSGTILDLKYNYMDSLIKDHLTINSKEKETVGNVIMISGCNDMQTSADAFIDNKFQGAMTWVFLKTYSPNKTWINLLKDMRSELKNKGLNQIPQLTSGRLLDINNKIVF